MRARPYSVYAVRGYSPDDVVAALEQASRARTPAYPLVASIKQLIIEDYFATSGSREISWREVLKTTSSHSRGYYSADIANLVARELSREGIKVWR